jgi:hypothetical protein
LEGVSTKVFGKVFFSSQNNKDNEWYYNFHLI